MIEEFDNMDVLPGPNWFTTQSDREQQLLWKWTSRKNATLEKKYWKKLFPWNHSPLKQTPLSLKHTATQQLAAENDKQSFLLTCATIL